MSNEDIRGAIKVNGLKHYEIAKYLGISETTLVRHLRYELPKEEKERILRIIEENKKGE